MIGGSICQGMLMRRGRIGRGGLFGGFGICVLGLVRLKRMSTNRIRWKLRSGRGRR